MARQVRLSYREATRQNLEDLVESALRQHQKPGVAVSVLRKAAELLVELPPEEPTLPEDPAGLSFQIAGSIECDLGVKQRLLAERSTAGRVKALMLLLPVLNSTVEKGITVHRRAHTNGKGGTVPDVFTSS